MLVDMLAKSSKIEKSKLLSLAKGASRRYKVYQIPKRDGRARTIEHPSRELKSIQRWIIRALFERFPVHDSATAYRKGSGIRENAERHRFSRYTNRYDFMNFFPSFTQARVETFLRNESAKLGIELTEEDYFFVGNIVCRNGRLTIGAPSSPAITNAMMFDFDAYMYNHCIERNLVFTRYADDIFVSSSEADQLNDIEDEIRRAKRSIPHISLRINRDKTTYLSKKYCRHVTGVIITPDHKLSVGRDRKRAIKALVHKWLNGKLDLSEISHLRGLVAFARDIEPEFEVRLRTKYGDPALDKLLHDPEL